MTIIGQTASVHARLQSEIAFCCVAAEYSLHEKAGKVAVLAMNCARGQMDKTSPLRSVSLCGAGHSGSTLLGTLLGGAYADMYTQQARACR